MYEKPKQLSPKVSEFPLHDAIQNDPTEVVRLLRAGRKGTELDVNGETPLLLAISAKNIEIIGTLLDYEETPGKVFHGEKALELAIRAGNLQIVQMLIRKGAVHREALHTICKASASVSKPSRLDYDREDYPEYRFGTGTWGVLMDEWRKNQLEWFQSGIGFTVDALIKNGGNVSELDEQGRTPMYYAALNHCAPLVNTLLKAGGDPNRGTPSALAGAMWHGSVNITILLLKNGAKPDKEDKKYLRGWKKLFPALPDFPEEPVENLEAPVFEKEESFLERVLKKVKSLLLKK